MTSAPDPVKPSSAWRVLTLACVLIAAMVGGAVLWLDDYFTQPGPLKAEATVLLPRGTGFQAITHTLAAQGVIMHPRAFQAMALYHGNQRAFKAGEYRFSTAVSPKDVMQQLVSGQVIEHKLTIPEGLTVEEIKRLVAAEKTLTGAITLPLEEGMLLPETYHFTRGETRDAVLARMQRSMETTLAELWPQRAADLPFATQHEALALASIVEKETGLPEERGRVAAVFTNRLRRGMKLQADPTVAYGITEGGKLPLRPIRKSDLERNQPYNTYVIPALPPGPIACPGRDALAAVLNPPDSSELYFVATGTGGHHFAKTHKEHIRNVARYRAELRKSQ